MNPSVEVMLYQVTKTAKENLHKIPKKSAYRKWVYDLIAFDDRLEMGMDFPAAKLLKVKKYVYGRFL